MKNLRFFPLLLLALVVSFLGARLQSYQTHTSAAKPSADERMAQLEKTYGELLGPAHMPAYTAWFKQTIQLYKNGSPDGEPRISGRVQARRENRDTLLGYRFDEPKYKNSITTVRMSNGDVVEGRDNVKAKSTFHLHPVVSLMNDLPVFDPRTDCHTTVGKYLPPLPTYLGDADVVGIHTAMLQEEDEHAGQKTSETYYRAPELGCVTLKHVMEFHDDAGKLTQVSAYEADKIVIGEPDPALFDLSSYKEMDPKSAYDTWLRFNNWDPAKYPGGREMVERINDYARFHLTRQQ
jgi:hypothetical protein